MARRFAVVILIVVATSSLSDVSLAQTQSSPSYELIIDRSTNQVSFRNIITLRCRRNGSSEDDPDALFWLETDGVETDILNRDDITSGSFEGMFGDAGIQFTITRELEGEYSCGRPAGDGINVVLSAPILIVALPTTISDLEVTATTTFYTAIDTTVTLFCPVKPGRSRTNYYVQWVKFGDGDIVTVARVDPLNGHRVSLNEMKYNIDANFSLVIFHVDGTDNGTQYSCRLGVQDNNQQYPYEQVASLILTLIVDDAPTIVDGPKPKTVSKLQEEPAVFNCTAAGITPPPITWFHNGDPINNDNKYSVLPSPPTNTPDGLTRVTSTLKITSFENTDSGNVTCKVSDTQERTTTIAVLGSPNLANVQITTKGDIIFVLNFPKVIPTLMKLKVVYIDTSTNTQSQSSGSRDETYANTSVIRQEWKSSSVPQEFTVTLNIVGITESGAQVMGPQINFNGTKYNKKQQNVCEYEQWVNRATIVVVVLIVIFLVLSIVGIVLFAYCYRNVKIKSTAARETRKMCKNSNLTPKQCVEEFKKYYLEVLETIKNPRKYPQGDGDGDEEESSIVHDTDPQFTDAQCSVHVDLLKFMMEHGLRDDNLRQNTEQAIAEANVHH